MEHISCAVCRDLLPLVQDGVASPESCQLVEEHLKTCPSCGTLGREIPQADSTKIVKRIRRKVHGVTVLLLILGLILGMAIFQSDHLFYNAITMPILGVFAYLVFRWWSLPILPVLLLCAQLGTWMLGSLSSFWEVLVWTLIHGAYALPGILIAGLLHFAFRKEDSYEKP